MWRNALLCLCLALSGCAWFQRSHEASVSGGPRWAAIADSLTVRRLMGQDVLDQPLLPQPGNVWADVLPAPESGPPAAILASSDTQHRAGGAAASTGGLPRPAAPAIVAAAPPAVVSPAVLVATAPVAAKTTPVAATVVPAAATVVPVAAKTVPSAASGLVVQLAAARTAQSAEAEWRRLRQQAPQLTDGHSPALSEAEVNGQHVWRLRAAGFADVTEASAFCTGIRAVKADCWVVPPSASP
jgi:SPOR domain